MSGLLSRFTTFVPNATILSNDHNQELNRIVNLLNGTTINLKTVLKTSDAGDPPLELDQLSTGPILKGFQGGIETFRFRNDGSLRTPAIFDSNDNEELLFVATASAVNEFTMANAATAGRPKLSATGGDANIGIDIIPKGTGVVKIQSGAPVAGADAANKQYVDDRLVRLKEVWYIRDPIANLVDQTTQHQWIAPAGAGMRITKLSLMRRSGGHAAGDVLTWRLNRNGSAVGSGVSFNDTNNAANTEYSETLNQTMSSGDRIQIDNIALPGTASELDVSIMMEWEQKLT